MILFELKGNCLKTIKLKKRKKKDTFFVCARYNVQLAIRCRNETSSNVWTCSMVWIDVLLSPWSLFFVPIFCTIHTERLKINSSIRSRTKPIPFVRPDRIIARGLLWYTAQFSRYRCYQLIGNTYYVTKRYERRRMYLSYLRRIMLRQSHLNCFMHAFGMLNKGNANQNWSVV